MTEDGGFGFGRTGKSILLQRWEEERAAQSARHEAWLRGIFEAAAADTGPAPPAPPLAEAVLRLRAMLAAPAAGDLPALLDATFMLAMRRGRRPAYDERVRGIRVCHAVTDPAEERWIDDRYEPIRGAELFRIVAEDDKCDGVAVDHPVRVADPRVPVKGVLLSPGFAAAALDGRDLRPGAAPLAARSRTEIEAWLDLRIFPSKGRRLVEAPIPDGPVLVRAHAAEHYLPWMALETEERQGPDTDIWSPVFALTAADAARPAGDWGEGPSRILCPGLLALRRLGEAAPGSRRYGRFVGIGRFVGAAARAEAARRAEAAAQILALIPPGADRVPRSAFLSVEGAAFARRHPAVVSRAALEAEVAHSGRHRAAWVWGR